MPSPPSFSEEVFVISIDGFAVIVTIAGSLSTGVTVEPSRIVAEAEATLIILPVSAAACSIK